MEVRKEKHESIARVQVFHSVIYWAVVIESFRPACYSHQGRLQGMQRVCKMMFAQVRRAAIKEACVCMQAAQHKRDGGASNSRIRCWRASLCGVCWQCNHKLTVSMPSQLTVPAVTEACSSLLTGMGSPVRADSSTLLQPETTTPSTGMRSPGKSTSRSPGAMFSEGTWRHWPSASSRRAFGGRSPCDEAGHKACDLQGWWPDHA